MSMTMLAKASAVYISVVISAGLVHTVWSDLRPASPERNAPAIDLSQFTR